MNTRKLVLASLLTAMGTLLGHIIFIPVGVAKCFPVQHAINVIAAVLLGPHWTVLTAFAVSLLRNLLGTGSLLAFPGSMVGALLASLSYAHFKRIAAAAAGEIVGTGILGGLLAFPIATLIMGKEVGAFFFIVPFLISTLVGSVLGVLVLYALKGLTVDSRTTRPR